MKKHVYVKAAAVLDLGLKDKSKENIHCQNCVINFNYSKLMK